MYSINIEYMQLVELYDNSLDSDVDSSPIDIHDTIIQVLFDSKITNVTDLPFKESSGEYAFFKQHLQAHYSIERSISGTKHANTSVINTAKEKGLPARIEDNDDEQRVRPYKIGETYPRLAQLLFTIGDEGISLENIEIIRGAEPDKSQVRSNPYYVLNIPECNRTVFICEEVDNAVFIFNTSMLQDELGYSYEDLFDKTKEELDEIISSVPGIGAKEACNYTWQERVLEKITDDIVTKKMEETFINSLPQTFPPGHPFHGFVEIQYENGDYEWFVIPAGAAKYFDLDKTTITNLLKENPIKDEHTVEVRTHLNQVRKAYPLEMLRARVARLTDLHQFSEGQPEIYYKEDNKVYASVNWLSSTLGIDNSTVRDLLININSDEVARNLFGKPIQMYFVGEVSNSEELDTKSSSAYTVIKEYRELPSIKDGFVEIDGIEFATSDELARIYNLIPAVVTKYIKDVIRAEELSSEESRKYRRRARGTGGIKTVYNVDLVHNKYKDRQSLPIFSSRTVEIHGVKHMAMGDLIEECQTTKKTILNYITDNNIGSLKAICEENKNKVTRFYPVGQFVELIERNRNAVQLDANGIGESITINEEGTQVSRQVGTITGILSSLQLEKNDTFTFIERTTIKNMIKNGLVTAIHVKTHQGRGRKGYDVEEVREILKRGGYYDVAKEIEADGRTVFLDSAGIEFITKDDFLSTKVPTITDKTQRESYWTAFIRFVVRNYNIGKEDHDNITNDSIVDIVPNKLVIKTDFVGRAPVGYNKKELEIQYGLFLESQNNH